MITRSYFISLELQDSEAPKFSCGVISFKSLFPNPVRAWAAGMDDACKLWGCDIGKVRCLQFNKL